MSYLSTLPLTTARAPDERFLLFLPRHGATQAGNKSWSLPDPTLHLHRNIRRPSYQQNDYRDGDCNSPYHVNIQSASHDSTAAGLFTRHHNKGNPT